MRGDRFERIGVFRALQVGDLLVAVPALRALRAAFPGARLTLIGLPWASTLVERLPWLDGFLAFPGHPDLPERAPEPGASESFLAQVAGLRLDLAVQLHGSGETSNAIVARFGARRTAGFHPPGGHCPDAQWFVPWPRTGREAQRLMQLPLHIGAPDTGQALELGLLPEDEAEADAFWSSAGGQPDSYVCVHPGARWRSRRWPAERFAEVAGELRRGGHAIVLTGSAGEADALSAFRAFLNGPIFDASARTTLGGLAALIARARLLLSNDTGVAHVAEAVGTASVVVCSGADAARWAPFDARRHRLLHHDTACRPCTFERCPTGHECALGVGTAQVLEECLDLLDGGIRHAA